MADEVLNEESLTQWSQRGRALTIKQLSLLTGLKVPRLRELVRKGAPHTQETAKGALRFFLDDFLIWYKNTFGKNYPIT
jgi:phage terminase Nu1 subunit (DNA packaging protein)